MLAVHNTGWYCDLYLIATLLGTSFGRIDHLDWGTVSVYYLYFDMVVTPGRASGSSSVSYDLPPGEKRPMTESDSRKHLVGYRRVWERYFPWLVAVEGDRSVTGMMWNLCKRHKTNTVVSRVSTHGRSTTNPHFSPYWALAQCTGCLQCATIERVGLNYYGRGAC